MSFIIETGNNSSPIPNSAARVSQGGRVRFVSNNHIRLRTYGEGDDAYITADIQTPPTLPTLPPILPTPPPPEPVPPVLITVLGINGDILEVIVSSRNDDTELVYRRNGRWLPVPPRHCQAASAVRDRRCTYDVNVAGVNGVIQLATRASGGIPESVVDIDLDELRDRVRLALAKVLEVLQEGDSITVRVQSESRCKIECSTDGVDGWIPAGTTDLDGTATIEDIITAGLTWIIRFLKGGRVVAELCFYATEDLLEPPVFDAITFNGGEATLTFIGGPETVLYAIDVDNEENIYESPFGEDTTTYIKLPIGTYLIYQESLICNKQSKPYELVAEPV